jgi:signal transduction histidine kinase
VVDGWPSLRVLLVEDDEVDVENVQRSAAKMDGAPVDLRHCTSLAEACAAAGAEGFDVVLLDLNLPDSSGLSTVEAMVDACPDVPIIVLTAQEDLPTQMGAAAARAHDFLSKNALDRDQLQRSLTYASERKRAVFRAMEQERMATLGRLAAGIGHELKNPVSYILSNLQVLQEDLRRFVGPPPMEVPAATLVEWKEAVEDCVVGAEQLRLLGASLNALRDGQRAEVACELTESVRRAVAIMEHALRPVAELTMSFGASGRIQGDEGGVVTVLVHLLRRALEAIQGDPSAAGRVCVRTLDHPDGIALEIEDDGLRIPEEQRRLLFDLFRGDTGKPAASNLGLTVADQVCREWGWSLGYLESAGGRSVFRVIFPRAADHTRAPS